jgi:hypothetical protein
MRSWNQPIALCLAALLLAGCGWRQGRVPHLIGDPVKFDADQLKNAPEWVLKSGVPDAFCGVGSAYNVDRMFAVEAARLRAFAQLAASTEQRIISTASDEWRSDLVVGANSGQVQRRIQGLVDQVVKQAQVRDVYVVTEQVWGPSNTKLWRYRAYVLLVADKSLADLVR